LANLITLYAFDLKGGFSFFQVCEADVGSFIQPNPNRDFIKVDQVELIWDLLKGYP